MAWEKIDERKVKYVESPSYYAVIPANVRYANISSSAKLLYAEITALSEKYGYCFASNEYFSKLYGVNKTTVSAWVSQLEENRFICSTTERGKSGKWERRIEISEPFGKTRSDPSEKPEANPSEKPEHNTTSINTTSLVKKNKMKDFKNENQSYDIFKCSKQAAVANAVLVELSRNKRVASRDAILFGDVGCGDTTSLPRDMVELERDK